MVFRSTEGEPQEPRHGADSGTDPGEPRRPLDKRDFVTDARLVEGSQGPHGCRRSDGST